MLEDYFKNPDHVRRLRCGPLGSHLDSFAVMLAEHGYAHQTLRGKLCIVGDLGRWLAKCDMGLEALDERILSAFLEERRKGGSVHKGRAPAVRAFLEHLRCEGVVSVPEPDSVADELPLVQMESEYEKYLRVERGLVQATLDGYRPFVHRFLVDCFGDGPLRLEEIGQSDILDFIKRNASTMSPGRAQLMVTALRSFLRFIFQREATETDLATCVPTVPNWRLSSVSPPPVLGPPQRYSVLAGLYLFDGHCCCPPLCQGAPSRPWECSGTIRAPQGRTAPSFL